MEKKEVVKEKTGNNFRIMAYWSSSVRDYYGKKPVTKPEDLKGMTIRTQSSQVQQDFWKACGAIPPSVAWGELSQALQQGVVASAENDYTSFMLKEHHKTPNGHYISETHHDYTTRLLLMNGAFYDGLTDEQKGWIDQAVEACTEEERQVVYRMFKESKEKVIADGAEVTNFEDVDIDAFKAEKWALDTSMTVDEKLAAMIAKIGENMNIRRFAQVKEENGFVASYTHMGGKIGVLVDVETDVVNDAVKEMARNVAMQIAALKPQYTSDSEVSAEYIEHEKEILLAQIQNDPKESQKPEKVIQGMIQGRINKEMKEICLLDQVYVKAEDGKQSVAQYVAQVAKENGANITVKRFVRFETGEGMEKKEENFAEEVAKQMGK